MLKRYGEIDGVIFRNYGYDPYNMATKYKLSYNGDVFYVYVLSFKELKTEIAKLISRPIEDRNNDQTVLQRRMQNSNS